MAAGDKYQGLEKCGCKLCTCSSSTASLQHRLHCECAGVGAARAAGVAGPLADALFISARILRERDLEHEHLTALTAVWGQLVSHDIAYTLPISGDTVTLSAVWLLSTLYCAPCRLLRVLRRHVPQREPRGVSPHRDAELHLPGLSSSLPVHSTRCYMPLNTFSLSGVRQVRHRSQAGLSAGSKVSKHAGLLTG